MPDTNTFRQRRLIIRKALPLYCQTPVGVDFVFQCHKKNKNPHLILIYRKGLLVYNLGRVTVWVSRSCLKGVRKVSEMCLGGVWKVFRRCLEPYLSYPYQPNYLCCFPIETKFHSNFSISESSTIWDVIFFFKRTSKMG